MVKITVGFVSNSSSATAVVLVPSDFQVPSEAIIDAWNRNARSAFVRPDLLPYWQHPQSITQQDIVRVKEAIAKIVQGDVVAEVDKEETRTEEFPLSPDQWEVFRSFVDVFRLTSFETGGGRAYNRTIGVSAKQILQILSMPGHYDLVRQLAVNTLARQRQLHSSDNRKPKNDDAHAPSKRSQTTEAKAHPNDSKRPRTSSGHHNRSNKY
ncbi:hypothetical protein Pelo_5109 [Pelomyxa schiedti]|nr:hypothetical protein Pelo_5109 [Pelomyxa schiedti]